VIIEKYENKGRSDQFCSDMINRCKQFLENKFCDPTNSHLQNVEHIFGNMMCLEVWYGVKFTKGKLSVENEINSIFGCLHFKMLSIWVREQLLLDLAQLKRPPCKACCCIVT